MMERMIRRLVRALGLTALGGLVVWVVVAIVAWRVDDATLDLPAVLLLFGQLVIVPLGLGLFDGGGPRIARALHRGGWFGVRAGSVAALAALALPRGELAAAVAALYLLPVLAVGLAALVRFVADDRHGMQDVAGVAAAGFLVVGAVFFVIHRQGIAFGGMPEHILQLTAVHFHFTGYGLGLMAGALVTRSSTVGSIGVALLIGGMVVTPIGFLTVPAVQALGAILVVAALLVVAVGSVTTLGRIGSGAARRLLFVSSVFAWVVGGMAFTYALSEAFGSPVIPLVAMAGLHGTFAAVGVVFCGLLGWRLAQADR
jgi:hypothetical protein